MLKSLQFMHWIVEEDELFEPITSDGHSLGWADFGSDSIHDS